VRKWSKRIAKGLGVVALLVLVAIGVFVGLNWQPDRPVSALEGRWAKEPSKFVEIDGLRIHVRDEGPKTDTSPLVLLHGTSASLHTWDGWVEGIGDKRRVIRLDLPGFGLTGPPPDGDYHLEAYVRRIVALLDSLGVERFALVGNSFGGAISIAIAHAHPARVTKLVLVDAAGYKVDSVSVPIGFRIARTPVLGRLAQVTLPRSLIESSLRNVYGDPSKVTPELVDRYFELTLREGNRRALVERFRQAPPGELESRIPELRLPTLILWGGRDRLIPPAYGERFEHDIPGSKRVVFDELGHVPHEEAPEATLAAALAFLQAGA